MIEPDTVEKIFYYDKGSSNTLAYPGVYSRGRGIVAVYHLFSKRSFVMREMISTDFPMMVVW